MSETRPIFFDIKRYALHDGPNIRTTVFFKGCPLRCIWCHNPEGMGSGLEIVTVQERCIGCRECLHGCPEGALVWRGERIERDLARCTLCLNCVEICPALAHEAVGYRQSVEAMVAAIDRDRPFFDVSGGGVTFSGGEPLFQADHLLALLKRCGELELHRTVDTSGYAETETLHRVAEHTDLFLFDLKHMDPGRHREYTGVDNALILHNLRQLDERGAAVRVRFPLIGTINDDEAQVEALGRFVAGLRHINAVDLLVYHDLAGAKYRKLGRPELTGRGQAVAPETLRRTAHILELHGLQVHIER